MPVGVESLQSVGVIILLGMIVSEGGKAYGEIGICGRDNELFRKIGGERADFSSFSEKAAKRSPKAM